MIMIEFALIVHLFRAIVLYYKGLTPHDVEKKK